MSNLDEAKAFLLKSDINGVSLHDHLSETLLKILQEQPKDALENFETISASVKSNTFRPTATKEAGAADLAQSGAANKDAFETSNKLFFKPDVQEEDEADDERVLPNIMEEQGWFRWSGTGLDESQAYRLYLSMAQEMKKSHLKTVRFFGKVLTTGPKDYFVMEAQYEEGFPELPEGEEPPEPKEPEEGVTPPEETGKFTNENVYFVATDAAGPWTVLPDVTPQQIVCARVIKKYFSGDLNATVKSYPPFPGAEREYLRAQIACISAATVLCPAGLFQTEEDDDDAQPVKAIVPVDEQPDPIPAAELTNPESWVHRTTHILKIGRCTNLPPPEEEEDDEAEDKEPPPEPEEPPAQLGHIGEDALISGNPDDEDETNKVQAWNLRMLCTGGGGTPYALGCARSNRWPGAVCIISSNKHQPAHKYASFYCGYGHENTGVPFTPQPPPPIMEEAEDLVEMDDPTLEQENAQLKEQMNQGLQADPDEEEDE